jgi:aminocarboxymuconate-semialdehyde decarboxylase
VIVDIHGHLSPPEAAKRFPMPPSLTDLDGMLAARADAGIDLTIIGSPVGAGAMARVPGVDNYQQSRDRLAAFHGWMASLFDEFPRHLRGYVYANPYGDDDHLAGVLETLSHPGFVGLIINSSVRGRFLDSLDADPFFAMAAEADVPIMVHAPAEPAGAESVADLRFVEQISRFGDVTTGLAMIAFAGWLEKYPNLRIIGATGGGSIAALAERLDGAVRPRHWGPPRGARPGGPPTGGPPAGGPPAGGPPGPPADRPVGKRPGESVRRMYVDTAVSGVAQLRMDVDVLGADHMMFGSDSPPLTRPLADLVGLVDRLDLTRADRAKVLGGNAVALFGLSDPVPALG